MSAVSLARYCWVEPPDDQKTQVKGQKQGPAAQCYSLPHGSSRFSVTRRRVSSGRPGVIKEDS